MAKMTQSIALVDKKLSAVLKELAARPRKARPVKSSEMISAAPIFLPHLRHFPL